MLQIWHCFSVQFLKRLCADIQVPRGGSLMTPVILYIQIEISTWGLCSWLIWWSESTFMTLRG